MIRTEMAQAKREFFSKIVRIIKISEAYQYADGFCENHLPNKENLELWRMCRYLVKKTEDLQWATEDGYWKECSRFMQEAENAELRLIEFLARTTK